MAGFSSAFQRWSLSGLTSSVFSPVSVIRFLPCSGFVTSPIIEACMPAFVRFWIMVSAFSSSVTTSSEPELMSWSGSMLKCVHIFCVSSGIRIFCL